VTSSILRSAPKIEGGLDAVVLGAAADGFAAAGLLARSGLDVVLIETGGPQPRERVEFAQGYFCNEGDAIASALDSEAIEALDLYRYGLSFAQRRLETVVRFADGALFQAPGDPSLLAEAVAEFSECDGAHFGSFFEDGRATARALSDAFRDASVRVGSPHPPEFSASIDGMLAGRFADSRLEDYLRAEAALGAAARPHEPFSFLALIRRWAGDAAGLQGGLAAISGGEPALLAALRRACQAVGVNIRQTDRVRKIIVEWDHVAGVEFDDGSQLRAPIVVSALAAHDTFLRLVGRDRLDIEFANLFDRPRTTIGSARVHFALNGPLADGFVDSRGDRRFLFAPDEPLTARAWRMAREGAIEGPLLSELVFPSRFDETLAPLGCSTVNLLMHPASLGAPDDSGWRDAVIKAAARTLERLSPSAAAQIAGAHVEPPVPAAPPVAEAMDLRRRMSEAGIDGLFYCGSDPQVGRGLSLAPACAAAAVAARRFKQGRFSR
jgi:phytoene dehydrogenase-like protein